MVAARGGIGELQEAASNLDLVARLPPPASYLIHTARFVFLWLLTLPLVLVDLMTPSVVPVAMLGVSWALYSTEELARLLEEPFGSESSKRNPPTVPIDGICASIVSELQQQAIAFRDLDRRVMEGGWVVKPSDVVPRTNDAAPNAAGGVEDVEVDEEEDLDDGEEEEGEEVPAAWRRPSS